MLFFPDDLQSPAPESNNNSRWIYLIQVASEKASELDALAAMNRGKKRKANDRLVGDHGSARAAFGQETNDLVALIMQRYEMLLGVDSESKFSSRRPRRFVGSVVRRLLQDAPGRSRFKSIDRARVFECQQLPPNQPLEPLQEYLVETTWDQETGLPDSCERLTGRGWLGRSAAETPLQMSCLLAQPQRPVDGGEFHFKLSPEDDDIVAYWCKSRASHYIEDWKVPDNPEPKPERTSRQPAWAMCGVISQRGLPCPQRKESCPYHRRNAVKTETPPASPRAEKVNGKREICGVMSQRGLRCSQRKGACPYHSNVSTKSKPPPPAPREPKPPELAKVAVSDSDSHEDDAGALGEEGGNDPVMDVCEEEQEQVNGHMNGNNASPAGKQQGKEIDLVTAACNFMVTVTEVDEQGACLLGWSYPPGCARDAGALLALSVAEHWRTAKLPSPLSTKMWREELAGGARKYIAENTGMGMCTFTSASLARVVDGQYVFVLVDSSGSARAISQPIQIAENKVVRISNKECRMSHYNQMDSQRRRNRSNTEQPPKPQSPRAPPPPAASPRARKPPVPPGPREIKTCPTGDAELPISGSRARKTHHSEWTLLGARFRKSFGEHGEFEGVVLKDDGNLGFLVKYASDTDVEHINAGELLELVHKYRSANSTNQ